LINKEISNHLGRGLLLPVMAGLVFILDQISKYLVSTYLPLGHAWNPLPALEPFVRLVHITNTGAAFGLFPALGGVFTVVAIVVAGAILVYYRSSPNGPWPMQLSLGLMLGGAVGNLFDRLRFGHVTDFIDVGFWPVFNLADSSIVVGVAILAYYLWREPQRSVAHSASTPVGTVESVQADSGLGETRGG